MSHLPPPSSANASPSLSAPQLLSPSPAKRLQSLSPRPSSSSSPLEIITVPLPDPDNVNIEGEEIHRLPEARGQHGSLEHQDTFKLRFPGSAYIRQEGRDCPRTGILIGFRLSQ
ncbi:hypothetical protein WAI453_000847 [Rhynchosporium graminicola]|uniref:Uncharacterized protein n=1 Tax=Rhynchosporium graminicola TaxID=2792576 RepID=A0A1E1K4T0_9HELO|nr:uncharacterized protein RCO7_07840 [Rhynchosporium commune]